MPKILLNARFVEAIRPDAARVDYWDSDTLGLCLRVTPNGVKTWAVKYRVGGGRTGRQRRFTIGHFPDLKLADARIKARRIFTEVVDGADPSGERDQRRAGDDVAAFATRYIDHLRDKGRAKCDAWESMLRRDVLPIIGKAKPAGVRKADIRQIMDGMKRRGATTQVNRTYEVIRAFFRWIGREYDDVLLADPTFGMQKPFDEHPRDRLLTDDEIKAIWLALGAAREVKGRSRTGNIFAVQKPLVTEPLQIAIKLLILTGQRSTEITQAVVSEINLNDATWILPADRTKAKRQQIIPLSSEALSLINRALEIGNGSPWLFPAQFSIKAKESGPISPTAVNGALRRVAAVVGVENVTIHDFRRLVASRSARLGFGDDVIGALLNHAAKGVTARHYNKHRYEVEKRRALDAWGAELLAIVGPGVPRGNVVSLKAGGE